MGGTIYALAGGKGGVGRTTTALNTGIALERAGYNTVIVDGDVAMTGATHALDVETESGVHGILAGTDSINDAVAEGPAGVTFVPGEEPLAAFADIDEAKLGRVIEPLAAAHDVVLVDTPPGLRPLHRDAYSRADGTVLVTTPDEAAVAAAEKTATVVDHVGGEVVGAAVTMADERAASATVETLDVPALAVVPDSATVAEETIVDGDSPAADAFERVASAIGAHADGETVEPLSLPSATATTAEPGERDDGTASATSAGSDTADKPEDPLEQLFHEDYTADTDDDSISGRVSELSERFGNVGNADALRDRLHEVTENGNGDGGALDSFRDRLKSDDDLNEDDLQTNLDEDPLEALFTDDTK